MERIETIFGDMFDHWGIRLPADAVRRRGRGQILEQGWAIWFLFDRDEDGEFLDYYAMHRMTNDRHVRIHEDGRVTGLDALPAIGPSWNPDDGPEAKERAEQAYWAECERISKMLEEKGFGLTGNEDPINLANRALSRSREDHRRLTEPND